MSTLFENISRITQAKANIRDAINAKGGELSNSAKIDTFAEAIANLPSGSGGGIDTSDANATAADILSGKSAYVNGNKINGSIQTVTASVSTNVVTVPVGYIANAQLITVGTVLGSQTITPGTSDQVIESGKYLTGAQTIKGDSALITENIKSGVTIFGVTGTYTSDANATAADILSGKSAYVDGTKVIGTASGGGSSTFSYPMNNTLVGSDMGELVPCSGYSAMDMEGKESWGGLFVTDTLLGSSRYVLSFPDQSDTMEEWDGELYPGWETRAYSCEIPIDPATVISKPSWSIEFCFCIGDMWKTYNQGLIFGSKKYGGSLLRFGGGYSSDNQFSIMVTHNYVTRNNVLTINKNQWCYAKFVRDNENVYLYIVPSPTQALIDSLSPSSQYLVCTFTGVSMNDIDNPYKNDVFFMGYESNSDYRIFKMANIKITVG